VRLTEFRELLIEEGVDPREVWRSICYEFDVPKERW
jgi:hypothetical protein